ncbi:hypothetical protein SteCoe_33275 [Stentor coeruleus]|uniref:PARP n=1 Tax=Stentor coeruleus TaxID=5963 RepID=A0A1R2AXI3_9CILI|nr:hypothetical protein SteCoe_33275 [Stentor coeruleus]
MVQTRTAKSKIPAEKEAKKGQKPAEDEQKGNKAVLVKVGNANVLCMCPGDINPRARSILAVRLNKMGSDLKYESKEELKINPKNIIKEAEVTKKGRFITLTKQQHQKLYANVVDDESEQSSEADVSEEESSEEIPVKSKKRPSNAKASKKNAPAPKKKMKLEVYKKGVGNPKIAVLPLTKDKYSTSAVPDYSVSISSSNRNVHRAVLTNNQQLFKALLKSNQKISTIYGYWSPECKTLPIELALESNNEYFIKELIKETNDKKLKRGFLPECSLKSIGTGFVSKQAYGVQVRTVQMSRGGREGNNAFLSEEAAPEYFLPARISPIIHKCTPNTINLMCTLVPNFENSLGTMVGHVVRSGNVDLARHLIQICNKKLGFGFNFLHEEVLKKGNLSQFKKVSITKKPIENFLVAPLHVACINPDTKHLETLIAQCEDLGYPDLEGRRVVHYAAACTSSRPLEVLVAHGANINEMDKKKVTPLMVAAMYNRLETVKFLVQKGASTKIKSREGKSAIHYAADNGCEEVLQYLAPISDVNQPGTDRKTPLMFAVTKGYYKCVEILLNAGAKVTSKDKCKRTALIWAVKNGQSKEASLLLSKGAPFDEPDSSKNYALHYAAAYGWMECLEILLAAGANVNCQNDWKMPPLLIAMLKGQTGCVERLLQEENIDINCKDEAGRTLLSQSIEVLSEDTLRQIKYFIEEKKADPNIPDSNGSTALHYLACKSRPASNNTNLTLAEKEEWNAKSWNLQEKAMELLINGKANVNAPDSQGMTPIMLASRSKNTRFLRILFKQKCDLSSISDEGGLFHFTPTYELEYNYIIKEILESSDNLAGILNTYDSKGFTAFLRYIDCLSSRGNYKYALKKKAKIQEIIRINEARKMKKLKLIDENEEVSADEESQEEKNIEDESQEESKDDSEEEDMNQNYEQEEAEEEEEEYNDEAEENEDDNEEESDDDEEKDDDDEEKDDEEDMDIDKDKNNENNLPDTKDPTLNINTEEIKKKVKEQMAECDALLLEIIKLLILKGADPKIVVGKLQKYRLNPELAKTEETENIKNFITTLSGEKIYKEYGPEGMRSALHMANKIKNPEAFQYILTLGINIDLQDFYGNTALLQAVIDSSNHIKAFIGIKANIGIQNHKGQTCIHIATINQNEDTLKLLLESGAGINAKDVKGDTALKIASEARYPKIVRLLCANKADPNIPDKKGRTALHGAFNSATVSSNASFEIEGILLNNSADINLIDYHGRSPLHYAFVKVGKSADLSQIDPIETVSSACSRKDIDVNILDEFKRTPLHYAARRGALTSTLFLLSKGALIDLEDNSGNTPLAMGILGNHSNYVAMLLQHKLDVHKLLHNIKPSDKAKQNGYYNNKLESMNYSYFRACVRLNWQGAAYLLLFAGYPYPFAMQDALNEEKFNLVLTLFAKVDDPSVFQNKNSEGQNLFHTLAIKGSKAGKEITEQIFQQLIDYKVSFTDIDMHGRTPLHYAAQTSNTHLSKMLLQKGTPVNCLDNDGNSPLVKAIEGNQVKNSFKILKLFKVHSADFSVRIPCDGYTSTALCHAIEKAVSSAILKIIIKGGCPIFETDSLGRNALMLLILNNDLTRVKFFMKKYTFDLNHKDCQGQTIIHYCIQPFDFGSYENKTMLTWLLQSGADASIKDNQGRSPSYLAEVQGTGTMKKVLESFKIIEKLSIQRKNSGFETSGYMEIDFTKDAEEYSKSLDDIKKVEEMKNEPDPAGDFADYYEVVDDYDVFMNKVDISYGPYSAYVFYRMQMLHDKNRDVYVVFTRWGRIGETGAFQRTPFSVKDEAEKEFKTIFKNKSGNEWGTNFVRVKGKYMLAKFNTRREINKDHIKDPDYTKAPSSTLPKEVEEVVKIFSADSIFREQLNTMGFNREVINLSNISRESILEAGEILTELLDCANKLAKAKTPDVYLQIKEEIYDLSNRYYEF